MPGARYFLPEYRSELFVTLHGFVRIDKKLILGFISSIVTISVMLYQIQRDYGKNLASSSHPLID